jgi:hypothetical protein
MGNLEKYYFYCPGEKIAFTIWKLPEAIFPELGINSNFCSLSLSEARGYLMLRLQSQLIYFWFKNLRVIIFLCPQSTLLKSTTPS